MTFAEGKLTFVFSGQAERYEQWSFYRHQFQKVCGGAKAVDFVVLNAGPQVWLLEAKDYRQHRRTKSSDLWLEFAEKVRDTLAGLCAASFHANDAKERSFAGAILSQPRSSPREMRNIRAVLHLEQPKKHSKLFPRTFDPSTVQTKIRQLLKAIDPHALVTDRKNPRGVPWTVR